MQSMKCQAFRLFVFVAVAGLLAGCSRSNNLLLGRIEATVAGHTVVVTDCYRPTVPAPEPIGSRSGEPTGVRFRPCRDADVVIRGDRLTVNGKAYGELARNDTVVVDHGVVRIEK
jgi:hypothetical protein